MSDVIASAYNLTETSPVYIAADPWSIAASADGSVIMFGDSAATNPSLYTSTDSGTTFSTYTFTDPSVENGSVMWVAMSEDGVYRVCFFLLHNDYPWSTHMSISEDSGSTWSNPIPVTLPTSNVFSATFNIYGISRTIFFTSYNNTVDENTTQPGYIGKYYWISNPDDPTTGPTTGTFTDLTTGKSDVNGLPFLSVTLSKDMILTAFADGVPITFVSSSFGTNWETINVPPAPKPENDFIEALTSKRRNAATLGKSNLPPPPI